MGTYTPTRYTHIDTSGLCTMQILKYTYYIICLYIYSIILGCNIGQYNRI